MNEEFINTYIDMMNNKISDLTKSEIMLQTRLAIAEKLVATLLDDKTKLEANLNKKASKTTKEDNSF